MKIFKVTSSGGVATATQVASYAYDAWGNVEAVVQADQDSQNIANLNPIRYRGYYYDTETKLYYLQSRYYDPALYRFVNADSFASTGTGFLGYNMFAYCENNPVNASDFEGERMISLAMSRLIHNAVARRVANKVGGREGLYVRKTTKDGKIKRGFLDVYDPKTNSYYEIKSATEASSSRTSRQMEKYDGAEPKFNSIGPICRGTEKVNGSFSYGIYDVTYAYKEPGLVTYTATVNTDRAAAVASVASILLIIVGICALGPGGAAAGATSFLVV